MFLHLDLWQWDDQDWSPKFFFLSWTPNLRYLQGLVPSSTYKIWDIKDCKLKSHRKENKISTASALGIRYLEAQSYLSILADHPNFPETRTQGDELRRLETWTLATLSPSCCFIQSQRRLYSCFVSLSLTSSSSPNITSYIMRIYCKITMEET